MKSKSVLKGIISIVAFVAAIIIGFIALFIPPEGVIDASVLWFTAQLLVFTSGILGINISLDSLKHTGTTNHSDRNKSTD